MQGMHVDPAQAGSRQQIKIQEDFFWYQFCIVGKKHFWKQSGKPHSRCFEGGCQQAHRFGSTRIFSTGIATTSKLWIFMLPESTYRWCSEVSLSGKYLIKYGKAYNYFGPNNRVWSRCRLKGTHTSYNADKLFLATHLRNYFTVQGRRLLWSAEIWWLIFPWRFVLLDIWFHG